MEMKDMETARNIANQRYEGDRTVATDGEVLLDRSDSLPTLKCYGGGDYTNGRWESRPTVDRHGSEWRLPPRKAGGKCALLGSYAASSSRSVKFETEVTYTVNWIFQNDANKCTFDVYKFNLITLLCHLSGSYTQTVTTYWSITFLFPCTMADYNLLVPAT